MNKFSDIGYLIDQISNGNKEAIDYFHEKYHRLIYKCMRTELRKVFPFINEYKLQEKLKDAYGEVLIKILSKIHQIEEKEEKVLRFWIWKVTRTTTINFINELIKKGRELIIPFEDNPSKQYNEEEYSAWEKESFQDLLERILEKNYLEQKDRNTRQDLYQAINKALNDTEKLVIKYYLEGFTEKEIAELMCLKRGKVHNIKESATEKLKEYFKSYPVKLTS